MNGNLLSESIFYQWDFYERAVNNYSVIMRMMQCIDNKKNIIDHAPKIFVDEMGFNFCRISVCTGDRDEYGFYSTANSDDILDFDIFKNICAGIVSPTLLNNISDYGSIYIYPLKNNLNINGHIILGRRSREIIDKPLQRELRIICDVFNTLFFLPQNLNPQTGKDTQINLFKNMLDELPDPLFLLDSDGAVSYVNKKAEDEFKSEKNHLVGQLFKCIFHNLDVNIVSDDKTFNGKVEYLKGIEYKVFDIRCWPLKGVHSENEYLKCAILRDTSEENIDNQQQLQKGQAESISLFTSGIAHDFNNHLTGILGYASLMKNFLGQDNRLLKYTSAIENSAQNAAKLTQHLLSFSRRQLKYTGIVDINAILNDLIFLIETSYKDIQINKCLCEKICSIKGNESEIQNALLNIFINAKDAMNGTGHLNVSTVLQYTHEKEGFAVIEIRDSGPGIDEELKKRIFEPYFSTKRKGNNAGIGLYLVKKAVSEHGGFIEIESAQEKGTAFIIYLPINTARADSALAQNAITENQIKSKLRVLIVEDEDIIRNFVKYTLANAGLQVVEAENGLEAINIFRESHQEIDLVILDIIMPGIKGDQVLIEMRKICKKIKIIVVSGFMSERQRQSLQDHHVDAFLDKPFKDKDLIRTICNLPWQKKYRDG